MKQTPGYFVLITSFVPGTASPHTAFPVSPGGLLGLAGELPPSGAGSEAPFACDHSWLSARALPDTYNELEIPSVQPEDQRFFDQGDLLSSKTTFWRVEALVIFYNE